ncbi:hypothetical protein EIP91_002579 [Steccherinum ochraceum]|uniref:Uncharacterized protein n=1 Tax=Steccherinum ochraceum TaxID=92696 RepID=A0A4R0RI92_9APHY|nr:hypothetical protein EIP91_002579 [Steccherinum ochraceum]
MALSVSSTPGTVRGSTEWLRKTSCPFHQPETRVTVVNLESGYISQRGQSSSYQSSGQDHPTSGRRPGIKRVYHTWHGETKGLTHFEDFMLEIGADPRTVHLCCVPSPGLVVSRHSHKHSKSKSGKMAVRNENVTLDAQVVIPESTKPVIRAHDPFPIPRVEADPTDLRKSALSNRRSKRVSLTAPLGIHGAPLQQLKSQPVSGVQSDYFSASFAIPTSSSAARDSLLAITGLSIPQASYTQPIPSEATDDTMCSSDSSQSVVQDTTTSEPIPSNSSSSNLTIRSRTSSITSLATASSSEGPETPRVLSPMLSSSQELHRSLSDLEKASRFRTPTRCVTCNKSGTVAGKDGKHSCSYRTMEPSIVIA